MQGTLGGSLKSTSERNADALSKWVMFKVNSKDLAGEEGKKRENKETRKDKTKNLIPSET